MLHSKTKLPLSIQGKNTIINYSMKYIKAKEILEKWYKNNNIVQEKIIIQRALLMMTFYEIINKNDKYTTRHNLWENMISIFKKPLKECNKQGVKIIEEIGDTCLNISFICDSVFKKIQNLIKPMIENPDFIKLMPYVLETFEYETNDLHINNTKMFEKNKKKVNGIYYTPEDVVNFITDKAIDNYLNIIGFKDKDNKDKITSLVELRILDGACGTGVFLQNALENVIPLYKSLIDKNLNTLLNIKCPFILAISNNIYGVDKSITAVESSIFTLIISNIKYLTTSKYSPLELYKLLSLNIKCGDSITSAHLKDDNNEAEINLNYRESLRYKILNKEYDSENRKEKGRIFSYKRENYGLFYEYEFPEVFKNNKGFNCVLGNPPYAKANNLTSLQTRSYSFNNESNLFLFFIENMMKLTAEQSSSGLIVPLSFSYNSKKDYKLLRKKISGENATWEMAFFDRSPDSIFGDNVKTRVAIIFRLKDNEKNNSIQTTKLLRWNSNNRDKLFNEIKFSPAMQTNISDYIPKIQTPLELSCYKKLYNHKLRLKDIITTVSNKDLGSKISEATSDSIYFYSTAYNWIPVFIKPPKSFDKEGNEILLNSLWAINCMANKYFIFSLLTSTLTYWLWIVQGDSFHLSKTFIKELPYHNEVFSQNIIDKLTCLGRRLWDDIKTKEIYNTNSGKKIGNFSFIKSRDIILEIDKIIISELNLDNKFEDYLKKWYHYMLSAGRSDFKYSDYI
ncbi:MAG: Eco57I restriction-modification methylase domain-containing protein [bacterium]